ncbi:hypothetical protein NW762_007122 [Fusarium torreyae]|uniref:Protamine P1 n=1 Tax=Fusarium torreyae TaxID=1237075 RepID=A0A9W8S032_9HYPO|nr:hypothetical protein NW762_007122 [Fusarium torreyae]
MTLQPADPLADELALDWGEDTIYCEATCDSRDVLYEGSDDEDYDNPESRKLRYEAAGQRFLDGKTPFLLTALLKGPFDAESTNWVNPWRSKHRTGGKSTGLRISPGKLARSAKFKRNVSIPETVQPPNNSLECHLPSPESLNQASETEAHPYLEEDELFKVQEWRSAVGTENRRKDKFWASTPQGTTSERKRKARGSSWLKLLANKRRRTDVMETGSIDTPVPCRPQPPTSAANHLNTSFTSVPDRLPSSAIAAERYFSAPHNEASASEDELSRDKIALNQAAADSSSPLSQLQCTPVLDPSINSSSQRSVEQQTPSKAPMSRQSSTSENTATEDSNTANHDASTSGQAFETQEDESFCFRMRPKSTTVAESVLDEDPSMTNDDEDTWSGLSSPDQDMDSIVSDLKDSTPVDERLDLQNSEPAMEVDQCGMTSPLSSISSEKFDGFNLSEESPHDSMDTASDASSATGSVAIRSDTGGAPHSSTKAMIEAVHAESPKPEQEVESDDDEDESDEDMGETVEVASQAETEDLTDSGTDSAGESDEEEDGMVKLVETLPAPTPSSKTPPIPLVRREAETTPPKPTSSGLGSSASTPSHAEFLLKASIKKRFIPRSSWDKLACLTGSPISQKQSDRRNTHSPAQVSSPVSARGKRTRAESTRSTPKTMNSSPPANLSQPPHSSQPSNFNRPSSFSQPSNPSQPSSHDASPTIIDTPVQEQHQEQERDQPNSKEDAPIPFSQQSPWAANKLSQYASLTLSQLPEESPGPELKETHATPIAASSVAQTPWTEDVTELPTKPLEHTSTIEQGDQTAFSVTSTPVVACGTDMRMQDVSITATPAVASTPEPQFSVKSFASFRSPSPKRHSHKAKRAVWGESGSRLPSTQGILASATKNPWEVKSSQRRVSFAPLPHETQGHSSIPATPCPSLSKGRPSSPPPDTPASELPTSEDAKFHKHFDAVARGPVIRHSQRLLPSESQCTVGSPLPDAMAETFITADQMRQPPSSADPAKSDRETDDSQDPFDMVQDVFREMGEFLDKWDVNSVAETPQKAQGPQSPW